MVLLVWLSYLALLRRRCAARQHLSPSLAPRRVATLEGRCTAWEHMNATFQLVPAAFDAWRFKDMFVQDLCSRSTWSVRSAKSGCSRWNFFSRGVPCSMSYPGRTGSVWSAMQGGASGKSWVVPGTRAMPPILTCHSRFHIGNGDIAFRWPCRMLARAD